MVSFLVCEIKEVQNEILSFSFEPLKMISVSKFQKNIFSVISGEVSEEHSVKFRNNTPTNEFYDMKKGRERDEEGKFSVLQKNFRYCRSQK